MRLIDKDALIEVIKKSMAENPHKEKMQRGMHIHEHKYFLTLLAGFPTIQSEERTEERTETHTCDLISRQVAIDALRDAENHAFNSFYKGLAKAHKIIADLPSVQPDHVADISKKVEGDCISRQAAIDAVIDEFKRSPTPAIRVKLRLEALPSAAPSAAQTTAPSTDGWIPIERELPDDLAEVNVTWVNPFTESKPFTASAVFYEGKWYWYSSVCADVLAEYGRNDMDKVDDMIEITAWRPLPEPYR